ncbi:hypothetical protein AO354_43035 [Pseudomonas syringae pv. syringae]|nr:hypothetical protein AO354_43035 [Pseudomonas syringae pv. syringae]
MVLSYSYRNILDNFLIEGRLQLSMVDYAVRPGWLRKKSIIKYCFQFQLFNIANLKELIFPRRLPYRESDRLRYP